MTRWVEQTIEGWGRCPKVEALCTRPERRAELDAAFADRGDAPMLAHGLGRSYGDAALLRDGRVVLMRRLDRMLDFDPETGWLRCEAGVSLEEIIATFAPRGFFPPVVPGTKFVTVGGALACDIHGKNHHVHGTFADHVDTVELMTASGEVVRCDAEHEPELFWATVGGLGLTGVILSLRLRLYPIANPYIEMDEIRVDDLDAFFATSAESGDFTHTVSWIDCTQGGAALGRGVFMRGRHAPEGVEARPSLLGRLLDAASPLAEVRWAEPDWLLNKATIRAFNEAYFRKSPSGLKHRVTHYEPFFFPLDVVRGWNRLYGKRGFLQYQFVTPPDPEHRVVRTALERISGSGMASFLAVIKEFGDRVHGGLSFPRPGVTLALDFPNHGQPLLELLTDLDDLVADAGGRVYLGKDARLSIDHFRRMYPEWETWKAVRDRWDPEGVFQSDLGRRLGLV